MVKLFGHDLEFKSRALKYGYANARAKAVKGVLLSPSVLDELIKVKTLNTMVELLQRTPYRQELVDLSLHYQGAQLIDIAAGRRFVRLATKLMKATPPNDRVVVEALLQRWDLLMLRTLFRAKLTGKSKKELESYVLAIAPEYRKLLRTLIDTEDPFGTFRKSSLGQQIMGQAISNMSRQMRERYRAAADRRDIAAQMDLVLDAYAYAHIHTALAGGSGDVQRIRRILQKEMDVQNIMVIERGKKKGADRKKIEAHILPGGRLPERILQRIMAAKSREELLRFIKPYWGTVETEDDTFVGLEIALEKALAREKVKAFHRSVLSLGTVAGALLILEEETRNLHKIAKAKEFGLDESEVKKTLVMVA
ncbi:MAG TPA: V-type ATPase subunit [Candidatus Bilamarchaeaceae archaeon]|nr:V-type ATPase subunit [Candidatus Bilamarchaeaceae archaeon]